MMRTYLKFLKRLLATARSTTTSPRRNPTRTRTRKRSAQPWSTASKTRTDGWTTKTGYPTFSTLTTGSSNQSLMPTNRTDRTRSKPKRGEAWKKAFLASIHNGATVTKAADAAGMSRSGVYDARISDPEFAEQWDKYQADLLESIEKTLYAEALGGDVTALIYVTKAKCKWSDKPQADTQTRAQLEAWSRAIYQIPPAAQKQLLDAFERELGIKKALEA